MDPPNLDPNLKSTNNATNSLHQPSDQTSPLTLPLPEPTSPQNVAQLPQTTNQPTNEQKNGDNLSNNNTTVTDTHVVEATPETNANNNDKNDSSHSSDNNEPDGENLDRDSLEITELVAVTEASMNNSTDTLPANENSASGSKDNVGNVSVPPTPEDKSVIMNKLGIGQKVSEDLRSIWITCFCVVTFDLEFGQKMEKIFPPRNFTAQEKTNMCFLSFPDSTNAEGDTVYSFRFKRKNLDNKKKNARNTKKC